LPRQWHAGAGQTRSCKQSDAAEVRILIENLYKFKAFGDKKLIREFSDKGSNFPKFE